MLPEFVVPLDGPAAATPVAAAGGKGARLAALHRAGFPVPPGFVVTTAAFRAFVKAGGLTVPERVRHDVLVAYDRLLASSPGAPGVAVRSSATTEDGARLSFAGAHDSVLGVRGGDGLLDAVVRCWSSLYGERALQRPAPPAGGEATVAMAVVVQRMVDADRAGVLFTVNPVTGASGEAVVNASWGLGDAVVKGLVTPDTTVVDKATLQVRDAVIGDKAVKTVTFDGRATDVAVATGKRTEAVLDAATTSRLVELGCAVEAHFGAPQDIEWAISGGRIHLLQARPVTGLPAAVPGPGEIPGDDAWPASGERPPHDFDLWTQVNVGEIWPDPVTPLVWSGVPVMVGSATRYALRGLNASLLREIQWARRFYGRVYYNEGAFTHLCSRELGLPASLVDRALGSRRDDGRRGDDRLHPSRLLRRTPFLLRFASGQLRAARRLEALVPRVDASVDAFRRRSLDDLGDPEIAAGLRAWARRFVRVMGVNTQVSISAIAGFGVLQWLAKGDGDQVVQDLLTGLPGMRSTGMAAELSRMAAWLSGAGLAAQVLDQDPRDALRTLRDDPAAQPLVDMLEEFLERHGHHCLNEGEWLVPRWAEAPEQVVAVLAGYLRAGPSRDPRETAEAQARRRSDAVAALGQRLGSARRLLFRLLLTRTQRLVLLRDTGKNSYVQLLYPIRRSYAVLGERWAARGSLDRPDDVFFLSVTEVADVVAAGDPAAAARAVACRVEGRRRAFEHWAGVEPPQVVTADHRPAPEPRPGPDGPVVQGLPISSGRARGTVRVVHTPRDLDQLRRGDILVTHATDPGWTSLFAIVSGLVVEVGGQLSHAAIVAREYGLPAVANVRHATRRLRSGQVVTVDGGTGHIHLDADTATHEE